jgi:hypothetical protein
MVGGSLFKVTPSKNRDPISKKTLPKKGLAEMAQGVGLEFKPQYCQKKKKRERKNKKVRTVYLSSCLSSLILCFYVCVSLIKQ